MAASLEAERGLREPIALRRSRMARTRLRAGGARRRRWRPVCSSQYLADRLI